MAGRSKLNVIVQIITRDGTVRTPEDFIAYYKAETDAQRKKKAG